MKNKLNLLLQATIEDCFKEGRLKPTALPSYVIEVPNNPEHGHFATNLPLALASSQRRPPREIASIIISSLRDDENVVEKAEAAGPGFINFRIKQEQWYRVLSDILNLREDYGKNEAGVGERVLVEFVSANPTGPLHLGHGRGAALGDTLCRVLSVSGYEVVREFYINDAGQQINLLGESVFSRFKQMHDRDYPFPQNGYHGEYIMDLAEKISRETDLDKMNPDEAVKYCAEMGRKLMLEEIKEDLSLFKVPFDVWFSENDLHESGLMQDALRSISEKGHLYEKEGALWIKTSDFGDDKDRVIKKSDGQFTYFASDIAYHVEKRSRGFTKAINIWGADHHGYVPRTKAALEAYGVPKNWLTVVLIQLVKLWKGGQEIRMSKRAGQYVTLRELIDEVGVDAARFVFLTKHHDSTLDFDVDLVKKQDSDNPVYYVQYAHARICSIFRKASSEGITVSEPQNGLLVLLKLGEEMELIRLMAGFPGLLEEISRTLEPHRLTYFLTDLAASFHKYFNLGNKHPEYRVVTADREMSHARLLLVEAVRTVIANGLRLLGINAPEKM